MKFFWKIIGGVFSIAAVFFFLLLVFLFTCEITLPEYARQRICAALSSQSLLFRVDAIEVDFPGRIVLRRVRLLDRTKAEARPMVSASSVTVELATGRLPWAWRHILKHVTVEDLAYPRLPQGYYIPDSVEFPGSPDFREKDEPLEFDFPELDPFAVTLVRPDILSVRATRVEIPKLFTTTRRMSVPEILLEWPDTDVTMSLRGELYMDLDEQQVRGGVHGQARTANIRPMLGALELDKSFPYVDGWTGVEVPVDAGCRFDVNLRNNDLHILLNLHPTGGAYNGVPMRSANGNVDIRVFVRDTFQNARIVVGPISGNVADGRALDGTVVYENTNDVGYVNFDVMSTTSLSNALQVADVMNDGTLDCLQPEVSPRITLKGRLAVDPRHAATNDLSGTLAFDRGTLFSVPLVNASAVYAVKGTHVTFGNARASAMHGGTITGEGTLDLPMPSEEDGRFRLTVAAERLALEDLARVFAVELGERHGQVDGTLELQGPMGTNVTHRLRAKGHLTCRKGRLAQLPLFANLTDQMARYVPGISQMVTLSRTSLDFTLNDGVFATQNLFVEGDVFSIQGAGTYSIPADALDFAVRVQLMRKDQLLGFGNVAQILQKPFTTMLFEFKVTGTLDKPVVRYVSLLDRTLKPFKK